MGKIRVLLTGNAGFIGTNLAIKLNETGYDITGCDNLSSGIDINLLNGRLREQGFELSLIRKNKLITGAKGISFINLDIRNEEDLNKLFKISPFDYVIHLAARTGVRESIKYPREYLDNNVIGFMNVLEACTKYGVKNFLFASSSSVYGDSESLPTKETDRSDYPLSMYAASKKTNECIAYSFSQIYGINCIGMRFFTVYGPWGRPDMGIYIFTKKILEGSAIELFNHGNNTRDFTYVSDIVDSILHLLKNSNSERFSSRFDVFNIGFGESIPIKRLVQILEERIGKPAIMKPVEFMQGDVLSTLSDNRKLKMIGFSPSIDINVGIERFLQWYYKYDGSNRVLVDSK